MSKLATWLKSKGVKRSDFAKQIGVSPSMVTQLCDGAVWPGRDVAVRIREATGGDLTADDFTERPAPVERPAPAERDSAA